MRGANRFDQFRNCRRCGKPKSPPLDRSTRLCVQCRSETECKHYRPNGLDPTCAMGVNIVELTAPMEGSVLRRPCYFIRDATPVVCDKFEPCTREEIEEQDRQNELYSQKVMLALQVAARIKKEHAGKDWSGTVECPACKGQLSLTHSAYNGHVWGRCATEGCVAWME